jgi:hypothetical protein
MHTAADIAREQDEGLRRLFQAGLELTLAVQANAMAAEPADQARLGLTFHRLSRGVRQTAALRIKLAREATLAEREAAAEVVGLRKAGLARRRDQVQACVQRLIWTETEDDDSRLHLDIDLDEVLDIEVLDQAFAAEPLETVVERICKTLGLPSPDFIPTPAAIPPPAVILRSGGAPDPGDPSGLASLSPQLGSPASPCGRAEDDGYGADQVTPDPPFRPSG